MMPTVKPTAGVKARDADGVPHEKRARELEAAKKVIYPAMLIESKKQEAAVEAKLKAKAAKSIASIKAAIEETAQQARSGVTNPNLAELKAKQAQEQGD